MQTDVRTRLSQWVTNKPIFLPLEWHPLNLTPLSGDFFNLNYVNVVRHTGLKLRRPEF